MRTLLGAAILALATTSSAAPCVTWEYPTQREDGSSLPRSEIVGVVIVWKRVMRATGTTYQTESKLLNPVLPEHCFGFTAKADYTFWIKALAQDRAPSTKQQWSKLSAPVTWRNGI